MADSKPSYRILLWDINPNACGYNRLLCPARWCHDDLLKEGIELEAHSRKPLKLDGWDAIMVNAAVDLSVGPWAFQFMKWLDQDVKIIWGLDDNYWDIPEWNPNVLKESQVITMNWFMNLARAIVVSTPRLKQEVYDRLGKISPNLAASKPLFVCPNLVEVGNYTPNRRERWHNILVVFWAGSETHHKDLEILIEPISDVLKLRGPEAVHFVFMGAGHPELARRWLNNGYSEERGVAMYDYFAAIRKVSPAVFLAPLAEHPFNHSKSNLKVLEGMAAESLVIASPRTEYAATVKHEVTGFLAESPKEWVDALVYAIDNRPKIQAMGRKARGEAACKWNWTVEECRKPWMDFFRAIPSL